MKISGYEKFSLVDFDDNITCTIFLSGCNFACPFCHNSSLVNNSAYEVSKEEVMDYLIKRKKMLTAVCISGGEPTLTCELKDFIKEIKELGYKIKLDSNGSNPDILKDLIDNKLIDYVAMDIKNSFDKYDVITNTKVNKDNIKKSIDLLLSNVIDYEFRTTLVKEYHDIDDIKKIALMIKGAKRYYLQKFVNSENCIRHDLHEIEEEKTKEYQDYLKDYIDNVYLRGY